MTSEPHATGGEVAASGGPELVGTLDPRVFELMVRHSADGMLAVDEAGVIVYANQAAADLLGRPVSTLLGAELGLPMATDDAVEVDLFHPARGRIVAELRVAPPVDGIGVAVLRDVSVRVEQRIRLEQDALTDALTGVSNRRGFLTLGEHVMRTTARDAGWCAVLFVDVDRMKAINDTFGHAAGDRALVAVATALRQTVRDADVVARVGGDEFCVLLSAPDHPALADAVARVRTAVSRVGEGLDIPVSATIGVEEFHSERTMTLEQAVARADQAMYQRRADP